MKDVLKELIMEFHHSQLPSLIERQIELPQLPSGIRKARVLIGMRRVGKSIYQVSVVVGNPKTREREVGALIEAAEALNVEVAYIITFDTQEVIEVSRQLTLYIIPYWQWALASY